jgi:hypothetical protein
LVILYVVGDVTDVLELYAANVFSCGNVADISEVRDVPVFTSRHNSTLKLEAACTPETSGTSPVTTRCNNSRMELTSALRMAINDRCRSL